jgi:two-component system response regulator YesN
MRIVIADDEYLARSSLRSMLEELGLPLDLVGEATNGEEMTALVGRYLPDVAFVDIRMPKLNGLETIRQGKQVSPETRWFILSGFPEFDYAQEAIRLGVASYLLKPVNPDELRKVLSDFIEQNRQLQAARNKQFERELMALTYGLTSLEFAEPDGVIANSHFSGAILYLDSGLPEPAKARRQFAFSQKLHGLIDQSLNNNNRIALIVLPGGELTTIGAWEPIHSALAEQQVRKYFQAVEQETRTSCDHDLAITLLVSQECSTYRELQDQLIRLQQLAPLRVVCGIGRPLPVTLLNQYAESPGWLEFSDLVLTICRCYQERYYLNYMKAVQQLEKIALKTGVTERSGPHRAVADFFGRSIGCQLTLQQGIQAWQHALQQYGEGLLHEMSKDEAQPADVIDQVLAFIDENYMHDIGIGQIAERMGMTPNYLSTLFHRKTGVNFMSYLKRIRLLKAKEILTDPNIQIQQVAEQVGYFSARHFARLFSEQFGCLPSEYRDRLKHR